jgi:hypothetical protein
MDVVYLRLEHNDISLDANVRSAIFFLSVTALMCFVFDHLLCPAWTVGELEIARRRHCWQTDTCDFGDGARKRGKELQERPIKCEAALEVAIEPAIILHSW